MERVESTTSSRLSQDIKERHRWQGWCVPRTTRVSQSRMVQMVYSCIAHRSFSSFIVTIRAAELTPSGALLSTFCTSVHWRGFLRSVSHGIYHTISKSSSHTQWPRRIRLHDRHRQYLLSDMLHIVSLYRSIAFLEAVRAEKKRKMEDEHTEFVLNS